MKLKKLNRFQIAGMAANRTEMVKNHFKKLPKRYYPIQEVYKILRDLGIQAPSSWLCNNSEKISTVLTRVNGYVTQTEL